MSTLENTNAAYSAGDLTLRALQAGDLTRLHRWLNARHLVPHYMTDPIEADVVAAKFKPRLTPGDAQTHPVYCVVARLNRVPYGYLQWYFNRDHPSSGLAQLGQTDGISVDYFIGETWALGLGLGSGMLRALNVLLLEDLPARDRIVHICHAPDNTRAIQCALAAGLTEIGTVMVDGKQMVLFAKAG